MNHHPRSFFLVLCTTAMIALSACTPLITLPTDSASEPAATDTEATTDAMLTESATATVATRSLRVRAEPNDNAEVIAGIRENEQYPVLAISSDGLWLQLAIDSAPGGAGWVSASFVTVEGPITDTATTEVAAPPATDTTTGAVTTTNTLTAPVASEVTATAPSTAVVTPAPGFAAVRTDGTRLRVRSTPSANAEIVGYVYNNEVYQLLEVSPDGLWVRIAGSTDGSNPDNPQGGWVAAEFIVVGQ